MRELIRQIEANAEFTNKKRISLSFLPNDPAAASFLEDEKKLGISPLSQHVATLHQRALQRNDLLMESSVLMGAKASVFGSKISENDDDDDEITNEEGVAVFSSSSWLPGSDSKQRATKGYQKKVNFIPKSEALVLPMAVVFSSIYPCMLRRHFTWERLNMQVENRCQ